MGQSSQRIVKQGERGGPKLDIQGVLKMRGLACVFKYNEKVPLLKENVKIQQREYLRWQIPDKI